MTYTAKTEPRPGTPGSSVARIITAGTIGALVVAGATFAGAWAFGRVSLAAAQNPSLHPVEQVDAPAPAPARVASVADIGNYRAVGIVTLPSGWLFASEMQTVPLRTAARPAAPFVMASLGPVEAPAEADPSVGVLSVEGNPAETNELAVVPVPMPSPVVKTARTVPLPASNPLVSGRLPTNDTPDDPNSAEQLAVAPPPRPSDMKAAAEADEAEVSPATKPRVAALSPADKPLGDDAAEPKVGDQVTLPGRGDRYAVYDITARVVYMPSGAKLEAHSGYGEMFDNPRYKHVKMRGPTPPNTYKLTMRESLFHGVEALRMTPIGDGKMYGRDGILAHTYMLGPRGDSNGCISFREYERFLAAYKRGEVNQIIVVESLQKQPSSTNPLIAWLTSARSR